jgi:[protein-PII] uridylyltransferase
MQHLAVDDLGLVAAGANRRRESIRAALGPQKDQPWFVQQLDALPHDYLDATDPERAAADLQMLRRRLPGESVAETRYLSDSKTVECTVGSDEGVAPGVFHRLTGALTGHGLQVRSAQITTMADGVVLDRFWCEDPDFAAEPPADRLDEIRRALVRSLGDAAETPTFRRTWSSGETDGTAGNEAETRVNFDNSTSDRSTIIDVFAADRPGLLYAVTRALFELDLSVWRAKIATHLDQVVDVFYVTDRESHKIEDEPHLEPVRARLLEVIDSLNEK